METARIILIFISTLMSIWSMCQLGKCEVDDYEEEEETKEERRVYFFGISLEEENDGWID